MKGKKATGTKPYQSSALSITGSSGSSGNSSGGVGV
jgi:hypothetical protein